MKPLNACGKRNPADTDGIEDKWEGNTPGMDLAKLNSPLKSSAFHPSVHEPS